MKLHKNLKIWLGLSTISIFIWLFWTNRPMEIIPFLIKNEVHFHQIADEYSEKVLAEIKGHTEAYPEYYAYYEMAQSADSLAQNSFKNITKTDFSTQKKYVQDNLLRNPFDEDAKYHKREIESVISSFYDYSNNQLTEKQLSDWSLNLIKSTMIQRHKIILLNYYKEKTHGSSHYWFDAYEPVLYKNTTCALVKENHQFQVGMSCYSKRLQNVRWWINEEAAKVRDGKAHYQERATKSGWNDLKIKYQGEYQKQIYTDSLTYRYYVCE